MCFAQYEEVVNEIKNATGCNDEVACLLANKITEILGIEPVETAEEVMEMILGTFSEMLSVSKN